MKKIKIAYCSTNVLLALLGCLTLGAMSSRADAIPDSAEKVQPLTVGAEIPDVTLRTVDGTTHDLRASAGKQPLVVVFYRGGWCPFCTRHLAELGQIEAELREMGLRIVAVSPDRPEVLAESVKTHELTYTLLSDSSMTAAKAFGIAFRVDDATVEQYKGYGIDLEAASGEKHHLLPVPAVFIIGTDGRIRFAYANSDYKVRLSVEALLEAARSSIAKDDGETEVRGDQ